jgi:hypothetical protein
MIEIREDDYYSFCADVDTLLYNMGIGSRINPLFAWDMLCETAKKDMKE